MADPEVNLGAFLEARNFSFTQLMHLQIAILYDLLTSSCELHRTYHILPNGGRIALSQPKII